MNEDLTAKQTEEDRDVGKYARLALPEDRYKKILRHIDYSGKPQDEQDRLIGLLTRRSKTLGEFARLVRSARGFFRAKERREQGEQAYQSMRAHYEAGAQVHSIGCVCATCSTQYERGKQQ